MEYKVTIDKFEGPLDLLLHLIKKSNINIIDINIVEITKQYLDYINKMKKLNLDIASSYLVMASELIEMKSNILLPKPDLDEIEEERQELINKLIDYEQYKKVTSYFKNLETDRREEYTKEPMDLRKYGYTSEVHLNKGVELEDLVNALNKFLTKKQLEKPLNTKITSKEYSQKERSEEIINIIKKRKKIEFTELFDKYEKSYVVVTFLSILDLARKSYININQEKNFNKIYIEEVKNEQ